VRQHDRADQPGAGRGDHRAARVHAAEHGHDSEVITAAGKWCDGVVSSWYDR
jgi:hypothetical protein